MLLPGSVLQLTPQTGVVGNSAKPLKAEGALPRVTGELEARADVGKPGTTLVTLNAAGERLGPTMAEFARELRSLRTPAAAPAAAAADTATPEESPSGTTGDH